jgi:hypothetical protein
MRNEVASDDRFSLYHSRASALALQCPTSQSYIYICSLIRGLSPVTEHSGIGLGPLIAAPDWFRHQNSFSFRYRTDLMPDSPACTKTVPR